MSSRFRYHARPSTMKSIIPHYKWPRINLFLLYTRLLFATIYLILIFTDKVYFGTVVDFLLSVLVTIVIIISDLVTILFTPRWQRSILSGTTLLFELTIIALYFIASVIIIALPDNRSRLGNANLAFDIILPRLAIVPILITSIVITAQQGRGLLRMKRDRGVRPLLVFTKTGDPLAVLPTPRLDNEALARLSVDSLQQFIEGADVG
ncbi:hypothetical protein F5Y14DRAFT_405844 [Nemania sp. NC0429]|nr:hypothetical protein F5Y14DRAFT_405844 [Nemania sp. NC0429]